MLDKFFKYTLWDKFLNNDQKKKKKEKVYSPIIW